MAQTPGKPDPAPVLLVEQQPDIAEHAVILEALRTMRTLLEGFPVDVQVKMVKALTARTMVVVVTQLHAPRVTPSA